MIIEFNVLHVYFKDIDGIKSCIPSRVVGRVKDSSFCLFIYEGNGVIIIVKEAIAFCFIACRVNGMECCEWFININLIFIEGCA